jgi:hypothetical protein
VCACDDGEVPASLQAELAREAGSSSDNAAGIAVAGVAAMEEEYGWISQGRTPDSGDTSLSAPPHDREKNELMAHIDAQGESAIQAAGTKR